MLDLPGYLLQLNSWRSRTSSGQCVLFAMSLPNREICGPQSWIQQGKEPFFKQIWETLGENRQIFEKHEENLPDYQ